MMKKKSVVWGLALIANFCWFDLGFAAEPSLPGEPIYKRCEFSIGGTVEQCTLYKVPAGKVLVLEMVAAHVFTESGERQPLNLKITDPQGNLATGNSGVSFKLEEGAATSQGRGYTVNQMVKLYYKENTVLQAYLLMQKSDDFLNEVSISGYLVSAK